MPRPTSNKSTPALWDDIREQPSRPEPPEAAARSNTPEITVSELSSALKRTVEDRFGFVRLRGEISNYRGPHASGHAYFCLKDEGARIDAVVWKTTLARMRIKPEEGLDVVAAGKITTFPGKSSYQIVVESLQPAGLGALMALLEERRRRLAAEGVFDAARKRALPYLPAVIGVVTSPSGAVIRDILHRVSARFPRHVIVWPVRVQGETSGSEVATAIRGFNLLDEGGPVRRPHVIIVARGGGSLEDLWGFNDEAVVRAVVEGTIPLIAAVGHETDWTLIDHAADLRAPTPTGAAELAIPVLLELAANVDGLRSRQSAAVLRSLDRAQTALRAMLRMLPSPADLIAVPRQRLDRASVQLPSSNEASLNRVRLALARLSRRLGAQSPQAKAARASERLNSLSGRLARSHRAPSERRRAELTSLGLRLGAALGGRVRFYKAGQVHDKARFEALAQRLSRAHGLASQRGRTSLASLGQLLATLSYKGVLARGYAIVQGQDGEPLRTAEAIRRAARFTLELADGRVAAATSEDAAPVRRTAPRRIAPLPTSPQGSLFEQCPGAAAACVSGPIARWEADTGTPRMNRHERPPLTPTEAKLEYGDGEYRIVRPGAFVRCAVSGQHISLEALRYWNIERQEAYASAEAKMRSLRNESGLA